MTEKTKAVPGSARTTVKHGQAKPVVHETAKSALQKKLAIKERSPVKKGVAFLIESELERAEVVLAAKGITTKLQDIAEELSTMEAKDIMPMLDSFRDTFGPQAADQFSQVATTQVRELINAVQTSKSALDNEITRLEKMVNGSDGSDVSLGAEMPPAPLAPPGDPALGGEAEAGAEVPLGDAGAGELPPPEGAPALAGEAPPVGATGFAGRARKEGARPKLGRKLTEENAAEGSSHKADMDLLAAMSPKCFKCASDIAGNIHDLSVSGDIRNKLIHALGHVLSMASKPESWDDPESIADMGVSAHLVGGPMSEVIKSPEVNGIIKDIRRFAHMIAMKHSGDLNEDTMSPTLAPPPLVSPAPLAAPSAAPLAAGPVMMESRRRRALNVKRLRESRNPDKMILSVFRNVFRECRNVGFAVSGTARAFGIDATDVVMIIREAKNARRVAEDAVPALMGVEMGKPDGNNNPALMSQVPPVNAANPQPGKPNQPMSPTDMRTASQARKAQDQASGIQPNQPITAKPQMAPVQQVKPQQNVQPVTTPQMQQQRNANSNKKPLPTMPGKVVNNSNMRTM
jgi:hypothetical protein